MWDNFLKIGTIRTKSGQVATLGRTASTLVSFSAGFWIEHGKTYNIYINSFIMKIVNNNKTRQNIK